MYVLGSALFPVKELLQEQNHHLQLELRSAGGALELRIHIEVYSLLSGQEKGCKGLNPAAPAVRVGQIVLLEQVSDLSLAHRSAENHRVGTVSVSAWQLEDRAEQRMSLSRAPESVSGRVRWIGGGRDGWAA